MTPYEKIWLWDPVRTRMLSRLLKTDEFNRYMHGDKASLELSVLLQTDEWHDYMNGVQYPMTEKLRRQLQALNGPHAETLLKVLLVRKEMKK